MCPSICSCELTDGKPLDPNPPYSQCPARQTGSLTGHNKEGCFCEAVGNEDILPSPGHGTQQQIASEALLHQRLHVRLGVVPAWCGRAGSGGLRRRGRGGARAWAWPGPQRSTQAVSRAQGVRPAGRGHHRAWQRPGRRGDASGARSRRQRAPFGAFERGERESPWSHTRTQPRPREEIGIDREEGETRTAGHIRS